MGFASIYNLLGPLINPAKPDACVLGVYTYDLGELFAKTLSMLGMKKAWVVCGEEGLDEISPAGPTNVCKQFRIDVGTDKRSIGMGAFKRSNQTLHSAPHSRFRTADQSSFIAQVWHARRKRGVVHEAHQQ